MANMTPQEAGKKGARARHRKPPEEIKRIAKKAAATRKKNDPDCFKKMGRSGALSRHDRSPSEERIIALKAARTRKKNDPNAFVKMGRKGGKARLAA